MLRFGDDSKKVFETVTDGLDELEREALEVIYRQPPQLSGDSAVERFPVDEHLLNAIEAVRHKIHTSITDGRVHRNSDLRFFRGGLRQTLL